MYIDTRNLQTSKCSWLKIKKQRENKFNELEAWSTCKGLKKAVKVNTIKEMDLPFLVCENKISVAKEGKCYHF